MEDSFELYESGKIDQSLHLFFRIILGIQYIHKHKYTS